MITAIATPDPEEPESSEPQQEKTWDEQVAEYRLRQEAYVAELSAYKSKLTSVATVLTLPKTAMRNAAIKAA